MTLYLNARSFCPVCRTRQPFRLSAGELRCNDCDSPLPPESSAATTPTNGVAVEPPRAPRILGDSFGDLVGGKVWT